MAKETNAPYQRVVADGKTSLLGHPRSDDAGESIYKVEPFTPGKIYVTAINISQYNPKGIPLTCSINTNIAVTSIRWLGKLKDSDTYKALEDISKYEQTHDTEHTLIILNPSEADTGDYICCVSTKCGEGKSETFSLDMKKELVLWRTEMERTQTKKEDYITPVDSQPSNISLTGTSNIETKGAQVVSSAKRPEGFKNTPTHEPKAGFTTKRTQADESRVASARNVEFDKQSASTSPCKVTNYTNILNTINKGTLNQYFNSK